MTTICADQVVTRGWGASVTMAATVFTVVTAELLPVGLLTPMAAALHVTEGTAGLSLTVTGVVSALAAPVLPLVMGKFDRRLVLVALMSLLGGVCLLTVGLARRVVPEHAAGPATSLIFSGIGIASVLGIPAGAYVGELVGW